MVSLSSASSEGRTERVLRRVTSVYRAISAFLLTTAVLFLIVNGLSGVALDWLDRRGAPAADPVTARYGEDALFALYRPMEPEDVRLLLAETWGHQLDFEPFTQTRERPFRGRFVNVDSAGFRYSSDQGPWPPDPARFNVFLFGGSTTFSYGLPDDQTLASQLQSRIREHTTLPVSIYNFGRGWYYSTQERILFDQLISKGFVPDLAIFVHGLNDFSHADDRPYLTDLLERVLRDRRREAEPSLASRLAAYRLAARVRAHVRARFSPATESDVLPAPTKPGPEDSTRVDEVIRRMDVNARSIAAVAEAFGVAILFVIQPVPTYHFDLNYHPFAKSPGFDVHRLSEIGYPELDRLVRNGWGGPYLTWCADVQMGIQRPLYVDVVHYTAELAGLTADCIARDVTIQLPPRMAAR